MIEIKNLKKEFDGVTPLKDVNVTINDGDVISIIGPSGTGKSTFLRCINLLETPTSGSILLNGEDITAKGTDIKKVRRKMGMVFQSFNLFGHLTVIENLMLAPMDLLKKDKKEAYKTGMEYLSRVGLEDKVLAYPDELSGGQKQRVAIARALCMDPEVILLDEPTSALDPTMVSEVQAVIRELSKSGKTMMIVTHEMNFARSISTRVFYMDEGGIYEEGTPEEIFDNPQKELTRRFILKMKLFEELIDKKNYDFHIFVDKLENYFIQNDISYTNRNRIRLIIEELVQQILFPSLDKPYIRVKIEYSMQDQSSNITVGYSGKKFDIKDTDNDLSLTIIKKMTDKLEYSYDEKREEPNQVDIFIGNK